MSADLRLLKDRLAVQRNLEPATARWNKVDSSIRILIYNLDRQTGGPRFVVSNGAVLYCNDHNSVFVRASRAGAKRRYACRTGLRSDRSEIGAASFDNAGKPVNFMVNCIDPKQGRAFSSRHPREVGDLPDQRILACYVRAK